MGGRLTFGWEDFVMRCRVGRVTSAGVLFGASVRRWVLHWRVYVGCGPRGMWVCSLQVICGGWSTFLVVFLLYWGGLRLVLGLSVL